MSDKLTQQIRKWEKVYESYQKDFARDGRISNDEAAILKSVAAKLANLREKAASTLGPDAFPFQAATSPSGKLEQGDQSVEPDPKLEKDPRVLRYRWNEREKRYQVTRYDPKLVKLGPSGRPLIGAVVKLDGHDIRLDDAIGVIRGWAQAKLGAVKKIEDTPFGTSVILSKHHCTPIYSLLRESISHCDKADAMVKAEKPEEGKKQLAAATKAYNDAAIKLNSAKRRIENNVELTVGVLSAIKAAGEAAEIVLMLTGAGAAAKGVGTWAKAKGASDWVVTSAKLATAASVKTGYAAADQVRDQLVFKPDEPVDWAKVGKDAAKNFFWNLVSDSIAHGLTQGLKTIYNYDDVKDIPAVKQFFAQLSGNLASSLLSFTTDLAVDAATKKETSTPRQLLAKAAKKNESQAAKLLGDAAKTISKDMFSSVTDTVADDFIKALRDKYPAVLKQVQRTILK